MKEVASPTAHAPQTSGSQEYRGLQCRATWLRILTKWHWISSALSLVGMFFFAATGITLNNAEYLERHSPVISKQSAMLPQAILLQINEHGNGQGIVLPTALRAWLRDACGIALSTNTADWRDDEIFVDLKRPGVDAWLSIDRKTGELQYEATDRGWVAFFNDLHKGKHAGRVWSWFITLFGACCLIFSMTGLLILQIHAKSKWIIWPITGLGLVVPLLVMLLFVH